MRGQDRPRRRDARRRPPARLRGARRRGLPLRLPQPVDAPGPATTATSCAGGTCRPTSSQNRFAFMLSKRQAEALRARLAAGEKIVLRARVQAKMVPATYDVVVATIPGTDPAAGEIVLTAHLCHESAGANDNASGSAAIFEVARALPAAIAQAGASGAAAHDPLPLAARDRGLAGLPRRGIPRSWRASWRASTWTWSAACSRRRRGPSTSRARPSRLPHVVNEIAARVVRRGRRRPRPATPSAAATRTPASSGCRARASRSSATSAAVELGSDHEVFEEASFGVPMVYFHDYPDVTIHTNKDQPENLDATKLGRVAYMGAGHRLDARRAARGRGRRPARRDAGGRRGRIALAKAARGPDAALVRARGDRLRASRRSIPSPPLAGHRDDGRAPTRRPCA